jgi:hypothetical protein
MFTPKQQLHVYTLTAKAAAAPMLPRSQVGMPSDEPRAQQQAAEHACDEVPSALWRETDLVPGSAQMGNAELKLSTCRISSFEHNQLLLTGRQPLEAAAKVTALAVDEAHDRCGAPALFASDGRTHARMYAAFHAQLPSRTTQCHTQNPQLLHHLCALYILGFCHFANGLVLQNSAVQLSERAAQAHCQRQASS